MKSAILSSVSVIISCRSTRKKKIFIEPGVTTAAITTVTTPATVTAAVTAIDTATVTATVTGTVTTTFTAIVTGKPNQQE